MSLYFTSEIHDCPDLFVTPMAVKTCSSKICNDAIKLQVEIQEISHRRPRSTDKAELGHFRLFCRGRQNARAKLLFCSLRPCPHQSVSKRFASTLIVFVSFTPVHTTMPIKREATWQRLSSILDTHGRVVWRPVVSISMTSPFSDSILFSAHSRKQRF